MNISYNLTDSFYESIGSNWIIDTLFLTLIPFGCLGFILNLISLIVLNNINIKNTKLYEYLKIYTLNSMFGCLLVMFSFYSYTPRYFNFSLSFPARFNRCVLFYFMYSTLYFYDNILDILIAIERLSIFINWLKKFSKPNFISLLMFSVSVLLNLPILFWFDVKSDEEIVRLSDSEYQQSFCNLSKFMKSSFGLTVSILSALIRDLVTLILEILISLLTMMYLRKFFEKKNRLRTSGTLAAGSLNEEALCMQPSSNVSIDANNPIGMAIIRSNLNLCVPTNALNHVRQLTLSSNEEVKDREAAERNMKMTIVLLTFSTGTHILTLFVTISVILNDFIFIKISALNMFLIMISYQFKHFSNLFIFYYFNLKFQAEFKRLFFFKK